MGAVVEGRKDNLTIQIGGINVPVVDVVEDLVAFGIPASVPAGIQDVIIQAAGGNITFEMAVRKLASTLLCGLDSCLSVANKAPMTPPLKLLFVQNIKAEWLKP